MGILRLSSLPSEKWRMSSGKALNSSGQWDDIRKRILARDRNTCAFCGFSSPKFMEVHHLRGWEEEREKDLVTVCPLCHRCFHIGFAGMNRKGSLLILKEESGVDQEYINRLLLDTVANYGTAGCFAELRKSLSVIKDLGPDGLVVAANELLRISSGGTHAVCPENFLFFPSSDENIVRWLIQNHRDRRLGTDNSALTVADRVLATNLNGFLLAAREYWGSEASADLILDGICDFWDTLCHECRKYEAKMRGRRKTGGEYSISADHYGGQIVFFIVDSGGNNAPPEKADEKKWQTWIRYPFNKKILREWGWDHLMFNLIWHMSMLYKWEASREGEKK